MQKILFSSVAVLALAGCIRIETRSSGVRVEQDAGSDVIQYNVMPGKTVVDPEHGLETWFGIGALSGVEGTNANGMAQLHVMESGTSLVSMQLNIAQAPEGSEYRAWLVSSSGARIDAGTLDPFMGDVRHHVNYEAKRDLRDSLTVEITLKKTGTAEPGTVVATGVMTERKRPQ